MTEVTLEFDIIMKGVDLLKLNHNVLFPYPIILYYQVGKQIQLYIHVY
jgi:hypothetical protein